MEALISLTLVDCSRLARTRASRSVTSCANSGSDAQEARTACASNSKASTGLAATAPKAHRYGGNRHDQPRRRRRRRPPPPPPPRPPPPPCPAGKAMSARSPGEHRQMVGGHPVQHRMGGQRRRRDLDHRLSPSRFSTRSRPSLGLGLQVARAGGYFSPGPSARAWTRAPSKNAPLVCGRTPYVGQLRSPLGSCKRGPGGARCPGRSAGASGRRHSGPRGSRCCRTLPGAGPGRARIPAPRWAGSPTGREVVP